MGPLTLRATPGRRHSGTSCVPGGPPPSPHPPGVRVGPVAPDRPSSPTALGVAPPRGGPGACDLLPGLGLGLRASPRLWPPPGRPPPSLRLRRSQSVAGRLSAGDTASLLWPRLRTRQRRWRAVGRGHARCSHSAPRTRAQSPPRGQSRTTDRASAGLPGRFRRAVPAHEYP